MRRFLVAACLLAAVSAVVLLLPASDAKAPLVPTVSVDPGHGSACVSSQPASDAGTATCLQTQDPDCLVETTYETIGGPYTVCTVPRP